MKKNGFTLIELLITIVLIGAFGSIIVFSMVGISNSSKEKDYELFVSTVESAAEVYVQLHPDVSNRAYTNNSASITVNDLIISGLVDENLENPYTEKKINSSDQITINVDSKTQALVYTFTPTQ